MTFIEGVIESEQAAAILKHAPLSDTCHPSWVGKIGSTSPGGLVAFVDGYAGAGSFEDGQDGSPLLVLQEPQALASNHWSFRRAVRPRRSRLARPAARRLEVDPELLTVRLHAFGPVAGSLPSSESSGPCSRSSSGRFLGAAITRILPGKASLHQSPGRDRSPRLPRRESTRHACSDSPWDRALPSTAAHSSP